MVRCVDPTSQNVPENEGHVSESQTVTTVQHATLSQQPPEQEH